MYPPEPYLLSEHLTAEQRQLAELSILFEVTRALQTTTDEDKTLHIILVGVTAGRGLGFNRAFLLLIDAAGELLRGRMALGPSSPEEAAVLWAEAEQKGRTLRDLLSSLGTQEIRKDRRVNDLVRRIEIPMRASEGHPFSRLLTQREACLVRDGVCQLTGRSFDPQFLQLLVSRDFAVAPLFHGDKNLGVLLADNFITRVPIEEPSLRLLQIYAQEAGVAIENMNLLRNLKEAIRRAENMNEALQESEQRLLQAERLSAIGKMTALVTHEIRTPLVSIGGFARRLLRCTPREDPRREEVEIILSEVARLESLLQELMGYSRLARPRFGPTDLNRIVASTLAIQQPDLESRNITIQMELDSDLPAVNVDESQIRQALVNLVSNALEAMPDGGKLTVSTRRDGDFLEIGVSDTGVGIAREHWQDLFTPFFTTKPTGLGLGLPLVAQVVQNHDASMRFDSTPGVGTTFFLRLALHPREVPAAAHNGGES